MNDDLAWIGCLTFIVGALVISAAIAFIARVAVLGHP